MLDDLGVIPALRELCNHIQHQTGMEIHLFTRAVPDRLHPEIELALYRIAQEALTNAVRHSNAAEVFVSLVRREGHILLSVEDTGKGFDAHGPTGRPGRTEGLGLMIMEERAILLGGRFHMESRAGEGTHIWADFPCTHPDAPDPEKEAT